MIGLISLALSVYSIADVAFVMYMGVALLMTSNTIGTIWNEHERMRIRDASYQAFDIAYKEAAMVQDDSYEYFKEMYDEFAMIYDEYVMSNVEEPDE